MLLKCSCGVFIMAMTKQEFSAKLLFWLLPWPISKILPRSLRIYYFGPSAGPPSGWYDYWGQPFPNPIDPYNPPPPDQFPDVPNGPDNPGDPLTPGPGPGVPVDQPDNFTSYFDNTCWEPKANGADRAVWDAVNKHWDSVNIGGLHQVQLLPIGTWYLNRRFSVIRFTFTIHNTVDFYLVDSAELLQDHEPLAKSYVYYVLDFFRGNDIGDIRFNAPVAAAFSVTDIEFL